MFLTRDLYFVIFRPHITFRTVFWSLFGRGEPTVVELDPFGHYFTETVGYWIFGVYNITTVIVLLNMLIAMMSRSFEIIQVSVFICYLFALELRSINQNVRRYLRTIANYSDFISRQ